MIITKIYNDKNEITKETGKIILIKVARVYIKKKKINEESLGRKERDERTKRRNKKSQQNPPSKQSLCACVDVEQNSPWARDTPQSYPTVQGGSRCLFALQGHTIPF